MPLVEPLREAFHAYRERHPWIRESDLSPKSVVRDMYEQGRTFSELVAFYGLARSEGLVLRYLSDAYRALRRTVPEQRKSEELDELIEWLGETVRQTDSSLLDEWEALTDPESASAAVAAVEAGAPPPPPRPITANDPAFTADAARRASRRRERAAHLDGPADHRRPARPPRLRDRRDRRPGRVRRR